MKKIFTLIAVLGMAAYASAQSFVFTKGGEVVEDNATFTFYAEEVEEDYGYGPEIMLHLAAPEDLVLKNNTSEDIPITAILTYTDARPWGISWCMGVTCKQVGDSPFEITEILPANSTMKLDYHADEYAVGIYGSFAANMKIEANGESRSVNINLVYLDPASVGEVSKANVTEVARYAADGRQLTQPQRGLNIVRMSDGSVKKVMNK